MPTMRFCIFSGKQFGDTFENAQWRKVKKCNQYNFASSHASHLNRHLKTHSEGKPNKCSQCYYASSRASTLREHLKMDSGEKSNKCNQCNFSSIQAGDLNAHLKIHRVGKSKKCNQCKFAASYASHYAQVLFESIGSSTEWVCCKEC